jgi:hypothetical protein
MRDYHQLDLWQRAMTYAVEIYALTAQLPDTERFNLTAQLRKAVTSVPLNIAEGSGCSSDAEFARFVGYAYRSLKEVITGLEDLPVAPGVHRGHVDRRGQPDIADGAQPDATPREEHGVAAVVTLTAHGSTLLADRDIKGEALGQLAVGNQKQRRDVPRPGGRAARKDVKRET